MLSKYQLRKQILLHNKMEKVLDQLDSCKIIFTENCLRFVSFLDIIGGEILLNSMSKVEQT